MNAEIDVPKLTTDSIAGVSNGTNDYEKLKNLPKINGLEIKGELKTEDLNIEIPKMDLSTISLEEAIEIANSHIHDTLKRIEDTPINSSNCYSVEYRCSEDDEITIKKHDISHDFGNPDISSGMCLKCKKNIAPSKPGFGEDD